MVWGGTFLLISAIVEGWTPERVMADLEQDGRSLTIAGSKPCPFLAADNHCGSTPPGRTSAWLCRRATRSVEQPARQQHCRRFSRRSFPRDGSSRPNAARFAVLSAASESIWLARRRKMSSPWALHARDAERTFSRTSATCWEQPNICDHALPYRHLSLLRRFRPFDFLDGLFLESASAPIDRFLMAALPRLDRRAPAGNSLSTT